MPQLSHEQRQRLFNYFAEAHDLLLLEDDFRMIDDLICSQHDGKPLVSGSLDLLAQLLSREMAKMDNAKTTDDIGKARMNMNAVLLVQELISKSFASDR